MTDRVDLAERYAYGIECPECGCRHLEVVRTIRVEDAIVRYRRCRHCGEGFTTHETRVQVGRPADDPG